MVIITITTTPTTMIVEMILVVEATHVTTMVATECTNAGPRMLMVATNRPTPLIWMIEPVRRCHHYPHGSPHRLLVRPL